MESIMVRRSESGTYEIPGSAEIEDWDEVRANADDVDFRERLAGWGWDEVWAVTQHGHTSHYFVRAAREEVRP